MKNPINDIRYTVTKEWCGAPKQMHIARFCGKWIGKSETESGAWMLCIFDQDERFELNILSTKRFKVWKASVTEYRIFDTLTQTTTVKSNVVMVNASFCVDKNKYYQAKTEDFKNSGDESDYFAWIEAEEVVDNSISLRYNNQVYYNPLVNRNFRDRITKEKVKVASYVATVGNLLTYKH